MSTPPSRPTERPRRKAMAANDGDKPGYRLDSSQRGDGELPEFAEAILSIVDRIPEGMVLAYGDVAEMLGQA